jgi:hypothetical protein
MLSVYNLLSFAWVSALMQCVNFGAKQTSQNGDLPCSNLRTLDVSGTAQHTAWLVITALTFLQEF